MSKDYIIRVAAFVAAIIFIQTLYFKFTGHSESVELFTKLGAEPWGRWATGVIELIASVLLVVRRTSVLGALLGVGMMLGAIGSHFLVLGIDTNGDGGTLFILAIVALVSRGIVLFNRFDELKIILGRK
ncbi:MAG: DoxX family protein [Cyclobacteriaceae bacterium]